MGPDLLQTKGYNLICIHVPSGSTFFGCRQHIFVSVHFRGRSALTSFCVCLEIALVCGGRYSSRSESEWVLRGVIFHRNQKRTLKHPPTVSEEQAEVSSLAAAHKGLATNFPGIVCAPSRVEVVEIQDLVHTMGGARANNTGISLQKKVIKMSGRVFLETVTAPTNQFPLIKHINFLQQFWKRRCWLRSHGSELWCRRGAWTRLQAELGWGWDLGGWGAQVLSMSFQWRPRKQLRFFRRISGVLFW